MKDGNIAALDAYFAQDDVRADVATAEAFIASDNDATRISFYVNQADYYPWYWTRPTQDAWRAQEFLFDAAVEQGQVEVIHWFFSPRRVSNMRATLTRLLPFVAKLAVGSHNTEILEYLLSCEIYNELLFADAAAAQSLLDDLASSLFGSSRPTDDMIQILLAHGSDVNAYQWRHACYGSLSESQIDVVASQGLVVVGESIASLVPYTTAIESARRLLQLGGDGRLSSDEPLHAAARSGEFYLAQFLLEEAFADVDARDAQGCTPLMATAPVGGIEMGCFRTGPLHIARLLIERGASVMLQDHEGCTALHHAIGSENTEITTMVLDHGADPNMHTYYGESVMDRGHLEYVVEYRPEQLVLLLEYGFDPFVAEWDGETLFSLLGSFEAGVAFVALYPQHFVEPTGRDDTQSNRRNHKGRGRGSRRRGRGRGGLWRQVLENL